MRLITVILLLCSSYSFAATRYVSTNSTPLAPYTNWTTAASTIQDAIDVSVNNDTIWVSNGVYNTGGGIDPYGVSNRVCITNLDVRLQSVNGAEYTTIVGGGSLGPDAVRCLYHHWGAVPMYTWIKGFTFINGRTHNSGGIDEQSGGGVSTYSAWVQECRIINCEASLRGGGIYLPIIGGLFDSIVSNNVCMGQGGGIYVNGGASDISIQDSIITDNQAVGSGGGIHVSGQTASATPGVFNCLIKNNTGSQGGGIEMIDGGKIINCTIVSNSAPTSGGGGLRLYGGGEIKNCIIYNNTGNGSPQNDNHDIQYITTTYTMGYCATLPMPTDPQVTTATMTTNNPLFTDSAQDKWTLSLGSPCIDAGVSNTYSFSNKDDINDVVHGLDGNNDGTNEYDMGCYEYAHPSADSDSDGIYDTDEIQVYGTNPNVADSDSDGLDDYYEAGTNGYYPSHHVYVMMRPDGGVGNWTTCRDDATNHGGHLATITSLQEWNNICYQLGSQMDSKMIWIGGYKTNETWTWVTDETWSYTNWAVNEPEGNTESLSLAPGVAPDILWDSLQNSNSLLNYYIIEFTNTAPITDPWNPDCDDDGLLDGEEVGVSSYELVTNALTLNWVNAQADAESRGGHLAAITSHKEWVQIDGLMHNALTNKFFWIGGRLVAGEWTWVTGETWAFTRWASGNPISGASNDSLVIWENEFIANPNLLWKNMQNGTSALDYYLLETPSNPYVTDPQNPDSDNDGMNDGDEVIAGTNPTNDTQLFAVDTIIPGAGTDMVISWNSLATRQYTVYLSTNQLASWTNETSFTDVQGNDGLMSYTNNSGENSSYYKIVVELLP